MASCHIIRRTTKAGDPRFLVRYRLGGAETPLRHAGSFKTRREADLRRRYVLDEIAGGRVPELDLEARARRSGTTVTEWTDRFIASRIDAAPETLAGYRKARARLGALGAAEARSVAPADVSAWVAALASEGLKRSTVKHYLTTLAQVLDHAEIEPNPARHRSVRLPREVRPELVPPTASQVAALIEAIPERFRLPLRVMASTGCRVGELRAMAWGDLDLRDGRWRVARAGTKTDAGRRWIPLSPDLVAEIDALVPRDDRVAERAVFSLAGLKESMARTCRANGLPHMSPHDLRHARASQLVADGVPITEVSALLGHARRSMTLDVYSHVVARD